MSSFFTILGGLAVFLVGLRMMSNGLQKIAGRRLRAVLATLTRNRFAGVFSGFILTCAVQSSSATTVLVVSFANAGLLTLLQAIGLVMGANIGTTLTAWIVSLLGFKIKIASFALPIIGLGFPLSLTKNARSKHLSEVMVGFGLLFLGLSFLKSGVPDLKSSPEVFEFLTGLANYGFLSTVIFVFVGALLTVVVQSSSAASAITLTLVAKHWIDLDLAAAMILGENIGTTITAQLAAIGANRNAKRVAWSHTLFNIIGVAWMLAVMTFVIRLIQQIIPGDPLQSALIATSQVALFHTMFNVTNTALLIGFTKHLERMVMRIMPTRSDEEEGSHLRFLDSGLMGTPELASVEVRRALQSMMQVCCGMFTKLRQVIENPHAKLGNVVDEIKREEQKTDDMEEEIISFCSRLAKFSTSHRVARNVARYLEMTNDIERLADHCTNLVLLAERRWNKEFVFGEKAQAEIVDMLHVVNDSLLIAVDALAPEGYADLADAKVVEAKINNRRDQSRKNHAQRMQDDNIDIRSGLLFYDMMTNLEKIGDYSWNVSKGLHQQTVEK